jgi:hypothetical protein
METALFILGCMFVGAVLNRFSGFTNIEWLPGRNIYWAALALLIIGSVTLTWQWGVALFLGALTYRIPGWLKSLDMGTYAHTVQRDALVMFGRGLYFFPPFLYAWLAQGVSVYLCIALLVIGSAMCVWSYFFGTHILVKKVKEPFVAIELIAGASLGLAFSFVYLAQ